MVIQISIGACVIPITALYIYNVTSFLRLLYTMSGMILITNIDNFFVELLKFQMDKNHSEIKKHPQFLQFVTCDIDQDTAYWWVMILIGITLFNTISFMFLNHFEFCPHVDSFIDLMHATGERFHSSNTSKAITYIIYSCMILQMVWILLSFFTIHLVKYFVTKSYE